MQEVFEKIIEEFEEECFLTTNDDGETNELSIKVVDLNDAIEIVKKEAERFGTDINVGSNGWIPCSEKLPELRQDVLVTVKYTGFMGMHGYWIQTGHMEAENDWWGDCACGEVIAWQPLPKLYKESD